MKIGRFKTTAAITNTTRAPMYNGFLGTTDWARNRCHLVVRGFGMSPAAR